MGCCQNRPLNSQESKPESESKDISSYKGESSTSLLNNSSTNNLILLLRSHYDSQDWRFLISNVPNKQKVHEIAPSPSWAKSPKTIGGVSLVFLTKACKKYPNDLLPIFEELHSFMFELLKNGTKDQKEQCILFINYLTILEKDSLKKLLINCNIFSYLIPHFYSEKFELRHICATTCARIYKMSEVGQSLFINSSGIKALMHILTSGPLRGRFFSRLLQCLIDLILLPNSISEPNKSSVIQHMDQSLITGVDVSLMNDPVREKFFELISLLHPIIKYPNKS